MEELDCDGKLLTDNRGSVAARDIVQFVRFNEAVRRGDLAEQVLREVPEQVCQQMENTGFQIQAIAPDQALYQHDGAQPNELVDMVMAPDK